jgi:hypothetical protein
MITVNIHSYTPTEMSVIKYLPLKILYNVMFNLFIWNMLIHFYSKSWLTNEVYLYVLMNQSHTIRTDALIKISTLLLIMILLHPVLYHMKIPYAFHSYCFTIIIIISIYDLINYWTFSKDIMLWTFSHNNSLHYLKKFGGNLKGGKMWSWGGRMTMC